MIHYTKNPDKTIQSLLSRLREIDDNDTRIKAKEARIEIHVLIMKRLEEIEKNEKLGLKVTLHEEV